MSITKSSVSKIFTFSTEPNTAVENRFWFDSTNKILKRYNGTSWEPINIDSDNVITKYPTSQPTTLTEYLSTLVEAIGDKQDVLIYIKEKQGENQLNTTITAGEGNIGGSVNITSGDGEGNAGDINISTGLASDGNGNINITAGDGSDSNNGRIYLKSPVIQSNGALTIDSNLQFSENAGIIGNDISNSGIKQEAAIVVTKGNSGGIDLVFKGDGDLPEFNNFNVNIGGSDKNNFGDVNKYSTINLGVGDYSTEINLGGENNSGTVNISTDNINIGNSNSSAGVLVNIASGGNAIDIQPDKLQINSIQGGSSSGNLILNASDSSDNLKSYIQLLGPNMGGSSGWIEINSAELKLNPTAITGTAIDTTITSAATDNHLPTSKAVYDALTLNQNKLLYYSETSGDTPSATISVANIKLEGSVAEGSYTTASGQYSHAEGSGTTASGTYSHAEGYGTTASGFFSHAEGYGTITSSAQQHAQGRYNIEDVNKYADIIGNGSESARSNAATVSWTGISWSQTDVRAGGTDQDSAAHSLSDKQNSTDTALNTTNKTIVGAINEINSIFNVNALPTPITDVKTITTTLENLITDTQYANKPGTILINPAITNTGAILVGENITDLSKAFPIYTDQPVTIAFKNINDFKVAGNAAGDKFNYIISFGYINQNIVSDSLKITTTNGVYTITPTGNTGSEKLTISKIS